MALCLHGFPDVPQTWTSLIEALTGAGYRVVAPWLRGYAPSGLDGSFDIESLANDVLSLAREVSPERPVYLVGHDWGAVIAYPAMAMAPECFAAAVTEAIPHLSAAKKNFLRVPEQIKLSAYIGLFQLPKVSDAMVATNDFAFIDRLWRSWSPGFEADAGHLAEVKACLKKSMPAPLRYYRALRPQAVGRALRILRRRPIEVPTLYVHGTHDGCMRAQVAEGQQEFFDGPYDSLLVEGAGHFVHLERPELFAEAVKGWCARVRSDANERELPLV